MGNIKKLFILVIMFILPFALLKAETSGRNYGFSLSPLVGFLYGNSDEIVFSSPNNSDYLSLLLWDLKPLFYAGIAADFGPRDPFNNNGFIINGSFRAGLPLNTGINENFDWMGEGDEYTHYSRHSVFTEISILADILLGHSWRLTDFLAFRAYGEFSFMHFSWLAKDGYGLYPWGRHNFNGAVVEYAQNWLIFSPGISLMAKVNNFASLEGSFSYSPILFCSARDHHYDRGVVFYDYLWKGHHFKVSSRLLISATPLLNFSLYFNYRFITETRGDTYINNVRYKDLAGAAYSALDMGLALRINIRP